jgi:hypothetical protein
MIHFNAHAEAAVRFAQDTHSLIVGRRLKAAAIGELLIDGLQTQSFLARGNCHEIDPVAKPFVHSLPVAVVASAGLSYAITRLPDNKFTHALLSVFIVGEGLNVVHNHTNGCN